MNIGIVTQWYDCGAGVVSKSYAKILESNHRVFIFARSGSRPFNDPNWNLPNVTWGSFHNSITGINDNEFIRWVKRNKINLVLFNEQRYWRTILLAKKIGILTGAYIDYYTQDTVPFFKIYDFLICNTLRHYSVFKNHPQCIYIPWGTNINPNIDIQNPNKRVLTFITSSGWNGKFAEDSPYMDRRGTGILLSAFKNLQGNCRLIVFSQTELENCPKDWQDIIESDNRIEFRFGNFNPFPYHEGDVYVYPSRLDGIGLTLPEALSNGLAAITTDNQPMNEFVKNFENGLLVRVKDVLARPDGYYWPESICDVDHLTECMNLYLKNNDLLLSHKNNALKNSVCNLNWENNASILPDWINNIKPCINTNKLLEKKIKRYDMHNNPNIFDYILLIMSNVFYKLKHNFKD